MRNELSGMEGENLCWWLITHREEQRALIDGEIIVHGISDFDALRTHHQLHRLVFLPSTFSTMAMI